MLSNSILVAQCKHPTFRDIETTHTVTVQDKSIHSINKPYNKGQSWYAKKSVLLLGGRESSSETSVLTPEHCSIRDFPRAT